MNDLGVGYEALLGYALIRKDRMYKFATITKEEIYIWKYGKNYEEVIKAKWRKRKLTIKGAKDEKRVKIW